ncbi:hypothetical protein [Fodinicola acaciae]|uniref:hypothetical protein n=1 Tax=Fodinicola acaciae TaxID=2681555 RepID=UPI001C9E1E94|nr:hypothetical protein [Fodinicola acaciae]
MRGQRVLLVILIANIVSTGLHYTDNFLRVDRYPQPALVPLVATQIAIVVAWPVLTVVGLLGYRHFLRGRTWPARACLLIYSFTGLVSLGHFTSGVPSVEWYWFSTIITDGLAGLALWVFVGWWMSEEARAAADASSAR